MNTITASQTEKCTQSYPKQLRAKPQKPPKSNREAEEGSKGQQSSAKTLKAMGRRQDLKYYGLREINLDTHTPSPLSGPCFPPQLPIFRTFFSSSFTAAAQRDLRPLPPPVVTCPPFAATFGLSEA